MNEETLLMQAEINKIKSDLEDLRYIIARKIGNGPADIKGTIVEPSIIPGSTVSDNSITNAKMADDAIKQAELDTEIVTLAFGSADTSKTASVTSGSIVIGVYDSVVTSTPATGELQLSISGTTLTGTRSAAPGGAAAITYTVILLKS